MIDYLKQQVANFFDLSRATRAKFGMFVIVVIAIEGLVGAIWSGFPLVAVAGIQAGVYATFVTGKSATDAAYTKNCTTNGHTPTQQD